MVVKGNGINSTPFYSLLHLLFFFFFLRIINRPQPFSFGIRVLFLSWPLLPPGESCWLSDKSSSRAYIPLPGILRQYRYAPARLDRG